MLAKPEIQARISEMFSDFNFDLVKASPLEITIIILKDPATIKRYQEYLQGLETVTTKDADLIIKLLCQTSFNDKSLFEKLKENKALHNVIEIFQRGKLSLDVPGYYALPEAQVLNVSGYPHVIEQIQLRVISERLNAHSVALNHLVNEIHSICWEQDTTKIVKREEYTAEHVVKFLSEKGLSHRLRIKVRNMFDRRNKNQVSHPGSSDQISWAVTADEYKDYRVAVGECLQHII